ncbi:MAG: hypothetical protein AAFR52_12060 [Pseudomonadota bacterium]
MAILTPGASDAHDIETTEADVPRRRRSLAVLAEAMATGMAAANAWEHRPTGGETTEEQVEHLRRWYFDD